MISQTQSLCPICLKKIPARRVIQDGNVYLEKECSEHGSHRVLLWREASSYEEWGEFGVDLGSPKNTLTEVVQGCPYDCGLCPAHKAETCVAIMEVTNRCDLSCSICFASSGEGKVYEPGFSVIQKMYETLSHTAGLCPVQLTGGEPTLRDDLPKIAKLGQEMGFDPIMVNTNGNRIAEDMGFLLQLRDNGVSTIYLQFDGVTDEVYLQIRNRKLMGNKIQALKNCAQAKISVVLVPTLIPGVNDHQIGDIVQLAKSMVPTVRGIHFQPVSYFGRYPQAPQDKDRITIPDVLRGLETQTNKEVKRDDFTPRKRKESYCAFAGLFVLMEDNKLFPLTNYKYAQGMSYGNRLPYEQARKYLKKQWGLISRTEEPSSDDKPGSWSRLAKRAESYSLSISCMPFQDVYNVDLERLERCCTHVVTPDKRLVPLCAYYLTSSSGERLYLGSPSK